MFTVPPSMLFTVHQGKNNPALPSPRIWEHATGASVAVEGFNAGTWAGDDFTNFAGFEPAISGTTALPTTLLPGVDGYRFFGDQTTTASTIQGLGANAFDYTSVQIFAGLTIEHECSIQSSGGQGILGTISDDGGDGTLLEAGVDEQALMCFETRVRFPSVTNDGTAVVGLGSPGLAVTGGIADGTGLVVSTGSTIGFQTLDGTPAGMEFTYKANGQLVDSTRAAVTLVANTWYKFGFVYDPNHIASQRIRWYVDNVEQGDYVTSTQIAAATFPDAESMSFFAGTKNLGTANAQMDIDWWYFYQRSIGGVASLL